MICNHQLKLHLHFHSFCHILQLCQKLIAHFSLVSVCLFISNRDFKKLFNLESTKNFPKEAQYISQLLMEKSVVDRIILCADEDDEKQQYVSTSQSPPFIANTIIFIIFIINNCHHVLLCLTKTTTITTVKSSSSWSVCYPKYFGHVVSFF